MLQARTRGIQLKISFFLFLLILGLAISAWSQSAGTGSIQGRVVDEKGGAVPSAKVTVRNVDTNLSRGLETDAQGEYRAVLLQPGQYEVTVQAPGLAPLRRTGIGVEVGSTATVNVELRVAAITETITVTGEAPITEPEKVEVTSTVTQKQIEELPINGRRWDNFVLLTPGVIPDGTFGSISYRGISGLLNNNTVDGADNNQAFFSEARGRTRTAYTHSQAAIKEFQVGLSTFSAEFGRAAGGTVNAVTKSGTNQLRGEVFYYVRDDALQAREPTLADNLQNPLKNKDRRQQYGLSLGLPFVKDKLFFFGNFDQQLRTETYLVRSSGTFLRDFERDCALPGLEANCNALLAFQLSQGGQQPRKRINNVALGKVDWAINPNHTLTGSYNWHRWRAPNGIQTGQVVSRGLSDNGKDIVKTDSVILRLNSVLPARLVNEAQFQYGRDFESEVANSTDPRTTVTGGTSFGMSETLPRPAWPNEKRVQWTDTLSWSTGRHTFRVGLDINYVRDNTSNIRNGGGVYNYTSLTALAQLAQDCPLGARPACVPFTSDAKPVGKHWNTFTQAFDTRGEAGRLFFTTTDYNFFVQDTFKWRPSVTVNMGLRYEFQKMPDVTPIKFRGTTLLGYPQFPETQRINQDTKNFGPRLAVAWDIGGRHKNVLRVGGGVYYGRTPNAIIRSHLLENGVALPTFTFGGNNADQLKAGPVYPNVLTAAEADAGNAGARSVSFMAGDFVRPFVSMADAAYERELTKNISVSATYVFTKASHLTHSSDINLNPPTTTINILLSNGTLLGTTPFYAGQRPLFDTLPDVPPGTRLGRVLRQTSDGNSIYHGIIFQLTQRARFGLTQNAHFTVSSARDEGQFQGASPFAGGFENFFDPRDRRREFARSELDVRRRFVWTYIWEPSRVWGIDNTTLRTVFGDWSFSGVTSIHDGQPFNPTISGSLLGGAASSGPNPCPIGDLPQPTTCASAIGSINGSGGSLRPGWLPRNFLMTTGFVNFDLRVQKEIRIGERKKIRFIWEAFNLFNRSNHPNRFNFSGTGFRVVRSDTCVSGAATLSCVPVSELPASLTLPRQIVLRLDPAYAGVLDPVTGAGDLSKCVVRRAGGGTCLNSASGTLFGARDMEFALKFIF